jgi:hypothetical protein
MADVTYYRSRTAELLVRFSDNDGPLNLGQPAALRARSSAHGGADTYQCFECCRPVTVADGQTFDGRTKGQIIYCDGRYWFAHREGTCSTAPAWR